jgi:two-component system chemotaxis response regulator CheB
MNNIKAVVIGASIGGMDALHRLLPKFKTDSYSVFVIQHISTGLVERFVNQLSRKCILDVEFGRDDMPVEAGKIYFPPGDNHMEIKIRNDVPIISLNKDPPVNFVRPSLDVLMKSIAETFKENSVGVILTGIGKDGAEGMRSIKRSGGKTIAQDEATSVVFSMPKSAIHTRCVNRVLPLHQIYEEIMAYL